MLLGSAFQKEVVGQLQGVQLAGCLQLQHLRIRCRVQIEATLFLGKLPASGGIWSSALRSGRFCPMYCYSMGQSLHWSSPWTSNAICGSSHLVLLRSPTLSQVSGYTVLWGLPRPKNNSSKHPHTFQTTLPRAVGLYLLNWETMKKINSEEVFCSKILLFYEFLRVYLFGKFCGVIKLADVYLSNGVPTTCSLRKKSDYGSCSIHIIFVLQIKFVMPH